MATKKTVLFHADQYKKLIHYTKEYVSKISFLTTIYNAS